VGPIFVITLGLINTGGVAVAGQHCQFTRKSVKKSNSSPDYKRNSMDDVACCSISGVAWGCSGIVCWVVRGSLCGCSVVVLRSFWGYHLLLSCLQPTASSLQPPVPNLQPPASSLQLPASNIQPPASDLQAAASTLQLESLWVGSGVSLGLFWACSGVRLGFVGVALGLFSACSRRCLGLL